MITIRLYERNNTGGKIEILFLKITAKNTWKVIHEENVKFGEVLEFGNMKGTVIKNKKT